MYRDSIKIQQSQVKTRFEKKIGGVGIMKTCRYCLKMMCEKRNNNNEYCKECVTEVENEIRKVDKGADIDE